MRLIFVCLLAAFTAGAVTAQEFEVMSVKPNKSGLTGSSSHSDRGMLISTNVSLRSLILSTYGLRDYQVDGPDWLETERFDISAKLPDGMPKDRDEYAKAFRVMMHKLLEERFKLAAHPSHKMLPVYALVIAKGGIKFKLAAAGGSPFTRSRGTDYEGSSVTMASLAAFLSSNTDRPVLDMTELPGSFDLKLTWSRELQPGEEAPSGPAKPVLQIALDEQLGLKLDPRKADIETLVIDHAERAPIDN